MRKHQFVTNGRPWSDRDTDLLVELREADSKTWDEIAEAMGRSKSACHAKYTYELCAKGRLDDSRGGPRKKVPAQVLEERDRRSNAPRSLSASLFGDPPQGFSALEGRGR